MGWGCLFYSYYSFLWRLYSLQDQLRSGWDSKGVRLAAVDALMMGGGRYQR